MLNVAVNILLLLPCTAATMQVSVTLNMPQPDNVETYLTTLGVTTAVQAKPSKEQRSKAALGQLVLRCRAVTRQLLLMLRPAAGIRRTVQAHAKEVISMRQQRHWSSPHMQLPSALQGRYTLKEENAVRLVLSGVQRELTPRQIKSLLNHHYLARCIFQQVIMQQQTSQGQNMLLQALRQPGQLPSLQQLQSQQQLLLLQRRVPAKQVQQQSAMLLELLQEANARNTSSDALAYQALVSWTFFLGRYPLAMTAVLKVS